MGGEGERTPKADESNAETGLEVNLHSHNIITVDNRPLKSDVKILEGNAISLRQDVGDSKSDESVSGKVSGYRLPSGVHT